MSQRQRSIFWLFALTVAVFPWALLATTVPWSEQNFPLIDDWSYARGAYSFSRGLGINYQGWSSMPLLGQWAWSVPFLAVLGESHLTLRLATLVLSWLGLWGFYDLLRRQGKATPGVAAFATACLGWNPYFFLLSGTFMTDVPALALGLMTLALYARAIESGRLPTLAAAVAVGLAAVATRQNAVAAPMAAGMLLLQSPLRGRALWLGGVAIPIAAAFGIHAWLKTRTDVTLTFMQPQIPSVEHAAWLAFTCMHYLGLMATPLLVLIPSSRSWKVFGMALAVMAACAVFTAIVDRSTVTEGVFPYLEDVLTASGPYRAREADPQPALFSRELRLLPTVLGCVCAAELMARAAVQGRWLWARPLVVFSLLQFAAVVIAPKFWDRYILMLVPGTLDIAAIGMGRLRWRGGLVTLALLGMLSVCLMHDWLALNAKRWSLGRRAIAQGLNPAEIDGGFEWDHWYPRQGGNRYRLSLVPNPQLETLDSESFTLWLPPRPNKVCLQRLE